MYEESRKGPSNNVKSSIYRKQIDEMISQGVTSLVISSWLEEQHPPEKIGKTAIYDYVNEYFNVKDKTVQHGLIDVTIDKNQL